MNETDFISAMMILLQNQDNLNELTQSQDRLSQRIKFRDIPSKPIMSQRAAIPLKISKSFGWFHQFMQSIRSVSSGWNSVAVNEFVMRIGVQDIIITYWPS